MRTHPALNMVYIWIAAYAAFFILPFKLENRTLSVYGFLIFLLFVAVFCLAGIVTSKPLPQLPRAQHVEYDFKWIDRVLVVAAVISIIVLTLDLRTKDVADLAASYNERSDRADALLHGDLSISSTYFKIGFLFYPAANIAVAREIIFQQNIRLLRTAVTGVLPIVLATLSLGGRAPLFYLLLVGLLAYRLRSEIHPKQTGAKNEQQKIVIGLSFIVSIIAMVVYFINVFFIRSRTDGDDSALFDVAREYWGISFSGYGSEFFFNNFGLKATYLIFIFVWYLVQGIVMSNVLFTQYSGGLQYEIYGIDLASAVARRVNGTFVADKFDSLLQLNTYGFLPSAFGSLYVDFAFFGLVFTAIWGWWTAFVYKNYKQGYDHRWMMVAPFVNLGIFFSLINTPLGFSNGFMTHLWLYIGFKAIRRRQLGNPQN